MSALSKPGADPRPPVQRLCAGEALLLTDEEVDLIDLVNRAPEVIDTLLDLDGDPDDYRLAEVLIEHLCRRYGIERHADGDRVTSVESTLRRHLIPFLVETDDARPAGRRGIADLRITHLERLPRVLSGDLTLPAATVAGDQLGRRGVACVYLSIADAAVVTDGGEAILTGAIGDGSVPMRKDVRTGEPIVMALDLRRAGLLKEHAKPHGIQKNTAKNVLRDLKLAIERARSHGAAVRGTYDLAPIKPLPKNLARQPRTGQRQVSLAETAALAGYMSAIAQVVLWMGRLVGTRIGEEFGLLVCDYFRDEDQRPWLDFSKQGGRACLVRDDETGRLVPQDRKPRTKTPKGERYIPIPRFLGDLLDLLIEVFHRDPETGLVDYTARLIPGIGKQDASGQSTFRGALTTATTALGLATTPHDLRDCLITDLMNGGIEERVRHFYAGHEMKNGTIQDRHYDLGVDSDKLIEVTDLLESMIQAELGSTDLRRLSAVTPQWGTETLLYTRRDHVTQQLRATGWLVTPTGDETQGRELTVAEVAEMTNKHPSKAREMMRTGTIRAHRKPWKSRMVWVAWEKDVETYLAAAAGTTINDLAEEVGWSYHQVHHVLVDLSLLPTDRARGEAIRLDPGTVAVFKSEVQRRCAVFEKAMPLIEASDVLDIPQVSVETLVRQSFLELTDGPTSTRERWVTRASVDDYRREFPPESVGDDQVAVPPLTFTQTRRLLRITRPQTTMLTTTRQLKAVKVPGSRHVYVDCHSALAYARRTGCTASVERIESHMAAFGYKA